MFKKYRTTLLMAITAAALLLSACGPSAESVAATQTESVAAIFTAAAQTIEAQAALATATPQPSETPTVSPTPTAQVTPTAATTTAPTTSPLQNYCDNSVFSADITIPDNTVLAAGQAFEKTWAIQNTGSCTWTEAYSITFVSGELMNGSARNINQSVAPQQVANVSVKLNAPVKPGTYTGYWRLANSKGAQFGQIVSVVIQVGAAGTTTVTATAGAATATNAPAVTATPTPTSAPAATETPTTTVTPTPN
jgi:hypothetical protein